MAGDAGKAGRMVRNNVRQTTIGILAKFPGQNE
jgi:hypothetical protein